MSTTQPIRPVMEFTAQWDAPWREVTYNVEGHEYCRALVSEKDLSLHHPQNPELSDPDKVFLGWDYINGSKIPEDGEVSISAYVAARSSATFTVTFVLGEDDQREILVPQNAKVPYFRVDEGQDNMQFARWELQSGNLTSSRTVMSDCVFKAVF